MLVLRKLLTATGLVAGLALTACDSDPTPIVAELPGDTTMYLQGSANGDIRQPSDYRLGASDRLRIIVHGQDKLTGEYALDGGGNLSFPLVGQLPASGMTATQLEKTIAGKLDPDYIRNASVSIEVLTRRPFFVVGEVKKPGSFAHQPEINVLTAVATAGGFTYRARKHSFYIKRMSKDGHMVRVPAMAETMLRPGDIVEVQERLF